MTSNTTRFTPVDADVSTTLICEQLSEGKTVMVRAGSNAMSPQVREGEQMRVRAATAHRMKCGDIVVIRRNDALECRRVLWRNERRLWTICNAGREIDAPCDRGQVVGRVVAVVDGNGRERKVSCCPSTRLALLARVAIHHVRARFGYGRQQPPVRRAS